MDVRTCSITDNRILDLLKSVHASGKIKDMRYVDKGSYSYVIKARDAGGKAVALKVMASHTANAACIANVALRELAIMQEVVHPNVIAVQRVFLVPGAIGLQLPLYACSLSGCVAANPRLPLWCVRKLFAGVAKGLAAMHAAGYMHRDVKPANILLGPTVHDEPVLADLGMARRMSDTSPDMISTEVITTWYAPPEVLFCCRTYGTSADVWSLGITLLEALNGGRMFKSVDRDTFMNTLFHLFGNTDLDAEEVEWFDTNMPSTYPRVALFPKFFPSALDNSHRFQTILGADKHLADLLAGMLCLVPHRRLTMEAVVNHPYFKQDDAELALSSTRFKIAPGKTWVLFEEDEVESTAMAAVTTVFSRAVAFLAPTKTMEITSSPLVMFDTCPAVPDVSAVGWHPVFSVPVVACVLKFISTHVRHWYKSYLAAMSLSFKLRLPTDDPALMFACFTVAHSVIGPVQSLAIRDYGFPNTPHKTLSGVGLTCMYELAMLEAKVLRDVKGRVSGVPAVYQPVATLRSSSTCLKLAAFTLASLPVLNPDLTVADVATMVHDHESGRSSQLCTEATFLASTHSLLL